MPYFEIRAILYQIELTKIRVDRSMRELSESIGCGSFKWIKRNG